MPRPAGTGLSSAWSPPSLRSMTGSVLYSSGKRLASTSSPARSASPTRWTPSRFWRPFMAADDLSKRLAGLTPEQRELLLRRLRKEGLAVPGESRTPAEPAAPLFTLDPGPEPEPSDRPIDFSLFFFS